MVVYLAVVTNKFLKSSCCFKPLHRTFSPSKRQVWVLASVVGSAAAKLSICNTNITKSRAIRWQLISCNDLWWSVLSHCFYEKFLRCSLVTSFCNEAFKHLAFMINRSPKVKSLSIYFNKNFVQMPLPVWMVSHPLLPDYLSKLRTKPVRLKPYRFVANIDTTLV